MAYNNSNSGSLFRNNYRGDNPKRPNLRGNGRVTIDGVEYELDLAAWTREGEKAGKYLFLTIKPAASGNAPQGSPGQPEDDEDLPF
jgi:hypothetical protein